MPDEQPESGESAVEQHVRKVLAQIGASKRRLQAQEPKRQRGSRDTVEIDREDDDPSGINDTNAPS